MKLVGGKRIGLYNTSRLGQQDFSRWVGDRQFQTAEDRAVNDGGKNVRDKEHMTMLPNWKVFCWTYEGEIRVEEEGCQTAASLQLISPQTATLT